jgi:hypothetical protein
MSELTESSDHSDCEQTRYNSYSKKTSQNLSNKNIQTNNDKAIIKLSQLTKKKRGRPAKKSKKNFCKGEWTRDEVINYISCLAISLKFDINLGNLTNLYLSTRSSLQISNKFGITERENLKNFISLFWDSFQKENFHTQEFKEKDDFYFRLIKLKMSTQISNSTFHKELKEIPNQKTFSDILLVNNDAASLIKSVDRSLKFKKIALCISNDDFNSFKEFQENFFVRSVNSPNSEYSLNNFTDNINSIVDNSQRVVTCNYAKLILSPELINKFIINRLIRCDFNE